MTNDTKRTVKRSSQFRKDVRLAHKQGKDINLLEQIVTMLANDEPLPEKHRDHALTGNWTGLPLQTCWDIAFVRQEWLRSAIYKPS